MAAKPDLTSSERAKILNFNIGVLGHIDSGKTSLAKALSSVASTASFDKNPQSRERGITLDLGFSSFSVPIPDRLKGSGYELVQFTLVDCPGHASLIRTIIGGAQIIDLMLLVVDVTKGIQTQTAECLVIGEITCDHMIIVLNKTDLLEPAKRDTHITKMNKRIAKTLESTRFQGVPIVPLAARPGGPEAAESENAIGLDNLTKVLSDLLFIPNRSPEGPFIFSVDHCFPIRGQGTVLTGTVLSGSVNVNDNIEIPLLKIMKKVKSIQMFHQPVQKAIQGDRVGICVTQLDSKTIERCLICTPGSLPTLYGGIFKVWKVRYHKLPCSTGSKVHITLGHETVMAKPTYFGVNTPVPDSRFDDSLDYTYQDELYGQEQLPETPQPDGASAVATTQSHQPVHQYVLLECERPVVSSLHSVAIGSKLDVDSYTNICRIAFHGILVMPIIDKDYQRNMLPSLKIYKQKTKEGIVERVQDEKSLIGRGLFKRETKIQSFVGLKVTLSSGEEAVIDGAFGTAGKFRLNVPNGLKEETLLKLSATKKKKGKNKDESSGSTSDDIDVSPITVLLNFKRYVFDPEKRMKQ